jgi:hypothetical protein
MKKISHLLLLTIITIACSSKVVGTKTCNNIVVEKTIQVSISSQLSNALYIAKPGDEIVLADGLYIGNFVIPSIANGNAPKPIILRGTRNAILDGANTNTGYVLHLKANYW